MKDPITVIDLEGEEQETKDKKVTGSITINEIENPDEDDGIVILSAKQSTLSSASTNLKRTVIPVDSVEVELKATKVAKTAPINVESRPCTDRNITKPKPILIISPAEPASPNPTQPSRKCPVCLCPIAEPTSTHCGHLFCLECITVAVQGRKECPVCRQKLSSRSYHRVYI